MTRTWCALGLAMLIGHSSAGDLEPPGPPASTPPIEARIPLSQETTPGGENYVYRITNPGSYYLTGNLGVLISDTRSGIEIAASDVTLDLNGFAVRRFTLIVPFGVPAPQGLANTDGIVASPVNNLEGITILNGHVSGWARDGIFLGARGSRIEGVSVEGSGEDGIFIGPGSTLIDCQAIDNARFGIVADEGSTVRGCTATGNETGLAANAGVTVSGCAALGNTERGITTSAGVVILASTTRGNGTEGIFVGPGSQAIDCVASDNGGDGIRVNFNAVARGCTASANGLNGIIASLDNNLILDNFCEGNGASLGSGAGIFLASGVNGTHVEGNTVTGNPTGIEIESGGNFLARNTVRGGMIGYDIVGGNDVGTIQTSPVGAGPWDNFAL